MHEYGMCEAVVDAVEARANGRPVSCVTLQVGVLHRVVPDAFAQAFALAAAGSVAEGAAVDLQTVPVMATCLDCSADVETTDWMPVCGRCGSASLDVRSGNELVVVSLTYAA